MEINLSPSGPDAGPDTAHGPAEDFDARRFAGVARLYGEAGLLRLRAAHVCVVGIGGVGSWAAEALARNAVGALTLIDLDHIAPSNTNRQVHALGSDFGMAKVLAMRRRIADINPVCRVTTVEDMLAPDNLAALLPTGVDAMIDATDDAPAKAALIAWARQHGLALIVCGAAGGKLDPTQIRVADLNRTEQEPLLAKVRAILRRQYGFPSGAKPKFGFPAVYSQEPLRKSDEEGGLTGLNCAGYGSSVCVTAGFGMVAASAVLRQLVADAPAAASCAMPATPDAG